MLALSDCCMLNNGYKIPCIGFGTWKIPEGDTCVQAIKTAVEAGYRHIDAAAQYKNEKSVGLGIRQSGVKREELFITGKLWNTHRSYEKVFEAFEKTLSDLQTDYLDLYLIHWPANHRVSEDYDAENLSAWHAMEELYEKGKIRSIGVANFLPKHLKALVGSKIPPMVDQIEFHPGLMWDDSVKFCREHNILIEAWSPLGSGRMLENEKLSEISKKYGKTVAQLCIRWILQHGHLPIPKSVTPERIRENLEVFDFVISEEDMRIIDEMDNFGGSGLDPDEFDKF